MAWSSGGSSGFSPLIMPFQMTSSPWLSKTPKGPPTVTKGTPASTSRAGHADCARQSQSAGQLSAVGRLVCAAQRAGPQNVREEELRVRDADEGRHGWVVWTAEPGSHRAHRRVSADVVIELAALSKRV